MEKKLPGVFVNKIGKKNNNKTVFYGGSEESLERMETAEVSLPDAERLNIRQKLNSIFKSVNYIYKIDVEIILKDKKITKKIIGYNETDIITFDNDLIPIGDVIDVKLVQKS